MENHQTVSHLPEASNHGRVTVLLPQMQFKRQAPLIPNTKGEEASEIGTADSPKPTTLPPTSLPYSHVARLAIAKPEPLFVAKRNTPKPSQMEDDSTFPSLSEAKMRAASEPKKFYRRQTKTFLPSPPAPEQPDSPRGYKHDIESKTEQPKYVNPQKRGALSAKAQYNKKMDKKGSSPGHKPSKELTEYSRSGEKSKEFPRNSGAEEGRERLFISHLKATFNIQGQMETGSEMRTSSAQSSAQLKESPEKKTPLVNRNNPSLDAESARQLDCTVQLFFPKHKPDPALSLSTNNSPQDVSHSSPSSPSSPASQRTVRKSPSSVPPTPLRATMGFETGEKTDNVPKLGNCSGRMHTSESGLSPGMVSGEDIEGIIMGGPALSPTRQGTFATQGRPEVIEHRGVPSMHGAIGLAGPGGVPVTGGWEQGLFPPGWQRLSAPYSPSIYDTGSTPLRPNFGVNYQVPEATTSRLSDVAIPVEALDRLFGQIEGLSKELGLVRAEVQTQTFQLQQLTAHINILRTQNRVPEVQHQVSVPTPTAAFRTPPSAGIDDFYNKNNAGGSPMPKTQYNQHHQRDMSDATIRHDGARAAVHPQPTFPYSQISSSFENHNYVPAPVPKNTASDTAKQPKVEPAPQHPVRSIVFGQTQQDIPCIPQRSPVLHHGHANQHQPPMKSPVPQQSQPMVVNSGAHHRRNSSTRSQRGQPQLNPFVPSFQPGNIAPEDNLSRAEFGYVDSKPKNVGTWGGTRNWYHEASYGNGRS